MGVMCKRKTVWDVPENKDQISKIVVISAETALGIVDPAGK